MISGSNFKSVKIDITTYKKRFFGYYPKTMNEDSSFDGRYCKSNQNRFICSICLNRRTSHERTNEVECCKRKSISCPKCQKQEDQKTTINKKLCINKQNKMNGKNIQTSEHEVTQGLTLLNEVLTVFQSKKQFDMKKEKSKTIIFRDACVGTDSKIKNIHHLTISKLFRYSVENNQVNENGKFTIISCQPEAGRVASQFSLDLAKHKSSSIPQMKLDELKNSFKEKTKSKDAIEEVNRMFATVRKNGIEESSDLNRPVIRNGPRVLPVVKTPTYESYKVPMQCKCCQTNYQMSSGDSIKKHECCHKRGDKDNECLYVCSYCQKDSYSNNCTVYEHCCHKDYKIQNVES